MTKEERIATIMKLAQEAGKEIPQSEAIARENDVFYAELFSQAAPTPEEELQELRRIVDDWPEK